MMTSPAQNLPPSLVCKKFLATLDESAFFLSGYSFQLCFFKDTLMGLSQVYTSKAKLGGEIS